MSHELLTLTLTELLAALRQRRASAFELMQAVLDRIDECNPALNAVVNRREREALLAEAEMAELRYANGSPRALEGIPVGVKDIEDAKGLPTTHGSLVFQDAVAQHDSVQVARLRDAGAIVVGKTNVPEFAAPAFTKNRVFGASRNPWNLERTPGGSSGGAAAALASCMLPLVTASDGGGSIRIPAAFVGAFGLKPSYGRVPRGPSDAWEFADVSNWGPLTKTVADAALLLDITAGASPHDPQSLPHPGYSYSERVAEGRPRRLRIAYSPDLGYAAVQSDIAAGVEDCVRQLAALGHTIVPVEGGPPEAGPTWGITGSFFFAARLGHLLENHEAEFSRGMVNNIRQGYDMTPERWQQAAERRAEVAAWIDARFEDADLLVTPTVPVEAFAAEGPYPMETEGRKQPWSNVGSFTIPFNLSWHPAATVRAGMTTTGLPFGMQIVGPRHRDDLVLQLAAEFERERPWHPNWALEWDALPKGAPVS